LRRDRRIARRHGAERLQARVDLVRVRAGVWIRLRRRLRIRLRRRVGLRLRLRLRIRLRIRLRAAASTVCSMLSDLTSASRPMVRTASAIVWRRVCPLPRFS
jgi:hypothetical protein